MKKVGSIVTLFIFLFTGCSVQEKMNYHIFFERMSEHTDGFDFQNSECYVEGDECICFIKDKNGTDYLFCLFLNKLGDAEKIGFSCNDTEKAEDFIVYIRNIISVYAPEENRDDIINSLTENGKIKNDIIFYETKRYEYCLYSDTEGFYFSVTNKKLVPSSSIEFSLKVNDKTGF